MVNIVGIVFLKKNILYIWRIKFFMLYVQIKRMANFKCTAHFVLRRLNT